MKEEKIKKNKKCRFCGRIHRCQRCDVKEYKDVMSKNTKICSAYGKQCRKCKKKSHWESCCQSKFVNETKKYMTEIITKDDTTTVNACEATSIIKIEGSV